MLVYYAHPQVTYGSVQEARDLAVLKKLGFQVYNPNNSKDEPNFREYGMKWFDMLHEHHRFDAVFYRPTPDDQDIASYGTGYEANMCAAKGIPVFRITDYVKALTKEQTGTYYAELERNDLADLYGDFDGTAND
jgi:hypothetical protein